MDALRTFTFHVGEDRQLTMRDLLRADVDQQALFTPYIEAQLGSTYLMETLADMSDSSRYATFSLDDNMLTLMYPFVRSGPVHAGMLSVNIPLVEIAEYLNPEVFD